MPRDPLPTHFFALVVVRLGPRFLLVHERKHGQLWYLPAGRVEPGERIVDAACRETLEESGVPVDLRGVLRIEHSVHRDGARVRVFFLAAPRDDTPPKSLPDAESLGAAWVDLADLMADRAGARADTRAQPARYPLRSTEVVDVLTYVAQGGAVYPLDLLTWEGAPWTQGAQALQGTGTPRRSK